MTPMRRPGVRGLGGGRDGSGRDWTRPLTPATTWRPPRPPPALPVPPRSYGSDTLEAFFTKALTDGGLEGQELGDAAVF